jgi:hypothetical protein
MRNAVPWFGAASIVLFLAFALPVLAEGLPDGLYRAEVLVTGTEEPERLRGFRVGLEEIIIKLTGKPGLKGSPTLTPLLDRAASLVTGYSYEDRNKHLPINDEQGTRERPHFLRFTTDPNSLNAVLKQAGLPLWKGERPRLSVWLTVKDALGSFTVAREGSRGYEQREILKSIALHRGIGIELPTPKQVEAGPPSQPPVSGLMLLKGTLTFSSPLTWALQWSEGAEILPQDRRARSENNFDTALRGSVDEWIEATAARERN